MRHVRSFMTQLHTVIRKLTARAEDMTASFFWIIVVLATILTNYSTYGPVFHYFTEEHPSATIPISFQISLHSTPVRGIEFEETLPEV